jgi:Cu-Zn family superoxide dismutase
MRRLPARLTLALVGVAVLAAPAAAATSSTVPAEATFPESVTVQPGTSTVFVSSFLSGAVVRGEIGRPAQPFLPAGGDGRTSASGIHADAHGHLLVIAGRLGRLQTYNIAGGRLLSTLAVQGPSHLNDLAITRSGDAYLTDFETPAIYKVTARRLARGDGAITRWLSPRRSVVPKLATGGNLNGIAATADGRQLVVDQTGNGALYRVDIGRRTMTRIRVTGGSLTGCDGLLLRGRTLYVATHGNAVLELSLNRALSAGRVTRTIRDPTLNVPTSLAAAGADLLVSNGSKAADATDYDLSVLPGVLR